MSKKPSGHTRLIIGIGVAWLFDAMDVGMLSFVIAALHSEWQLSTVQMGWIGSVSSIGMAVGAILFGMIADRFGRKAILILTLLVFSIGSGISAFATSYGIFLVCDSSSAQASVASCQWHQPWFQKVCQLKNVVVVLSCWKVSGLLVGC